MGLRIPFRVKMAHTRLLLNMADGSRWRIVAGDPYAAKIVVRFAEIMQLRHSDEQARHLIVRVEQDHADTTGNNGGFRGDAFADAHSHPVVCVLSPIEDGTLLSQFLQLSLVLSLQAQTDGGVLFHGALAARDGDGIILAGPGGRGKTTASRRLVPPWRSLSDDLTLVVRDPQGTYWAHPWPTWSQFMDGRSGGTWNVQQAVPLKGIFFLTQTAYDQIVPTGTAQAVGLLVESAEQALGGMPQELNSDQVQRLRLQRFENICQLAQTIPIYFLHLSLTGTFWKEIEQVIAASE